MSRRDARHFHHVFDGFWNVIITIIAYLVPPYGITWERRRGKNMLNIVKGFQS